MIYTVTRKTNGETCTYYSCRSYQDGYCDQPHPPAWQVEAQIVEYYRQVQRYAQFEQFLDTEMADILEDEQSAAKTIRKTVEAEIRKLAGREEKPLDLLEDGTMPSERARERLQQIEYDRERLVGRRDLTDQNLRSGAGIIGRAIALSRGRRSRQQSANMWAATTRQSGERSQESGYNCVTLTAASGRPKDPTEM